MKTFKKLFKQGAFRWSLGVRSKDAESFFAPQEETGSLLHEAPEGGLGFFPGKGVLFSEVPKAEEEVDQFFTFPFCQY